MTENCSSSRIKITDRDAGTIPPHIKENGVLRHDLQELHSVRIIYCDRYTAEDVFGFSGLNIPEGERRFVAFAQNESGLFIKAVEVNVDMSKFFSDPSYRVEMNNLAEEIFNISTPVGYSINN